MKRALGRKLQNLSLDNNDGGNNSKKVRLAIVDYDKCKPTKCKHECGLICPANGPTKKCITIKNINDIEDIGIGMTSSKSAKKVVPEKNPQAAQGNANGAVVAKKPKYAAVISSELCTGCNMCVKRCPFGAITIVNLPKELSRNEVLISYGNNSFRLYRAPHIKKGFCVGIIGSNGLGKTAIMKMLSGYKPDGKTHLVDINEKKHLLGGSELYTYLNALYKNEFVVNSKPQDITIYNKGKNGLRMVSDVLCQIPDNIQKMLGLTKLANRQMFQLSGGETQRLAIAATCAKKGNAYIFDEPSAYLDVKQQIIASDLIQSVVDQAYVILVEHNLSVFDYISDYVVPIYGTRGAYGIVASQSSTFEGINNYLDGFLPNENIRFRDKPIKYRSITIEDELLERTEFKYNSRVFEYVKSESITPHDSSNTVLLNISQSSVVQPNTIPSDIVQSSIVQSDIVQSNIVQSDIVQSDIIIPLNIVLSDEEKKEEKEENDNNKFMLEIEEGTFSTSEIILLIGENGTGKTTLIKILAGIEKIEDFERPELTVSIKEQEVYDVNSELNVKQYIHDKIGNMLYDESFSNTIMSPLSVLDLMDLTVKNLSGGQMQRVAIVICLGKVADMYLLDEPSAYMDIEDRMMISKILKQFIRSNKKTMFLVEHDMIMATSTCDKVIVFSGEPGIKCKASSPKDLKTGVNEFLKNLGVTMRRSARSNTDIGRPRINKLNSAIDIKQKKAGNYFIMD